MSDRDGLSAALHCVLQHLRPQTNENLRLIRIGENRDGGYVLAENWLVDWSPALYSFGIGDDVGFERHFMQLAPRATVFAFDPFIPRFPGDDLRDVQFCRQRMEAVSSRLFPLPDSVLKADVEWSEWLAFEQMAEDTLASFSQIVCEFHFCHVDPPRAKTPYFQEFYANSTYHVNLGLFRAYCDVLRKITQFFRVIHVHVNNSLPPIRLDGVALPPLIEASFFSKKVDIGGEWREKKTEYPIEGLDYANKLDRPDFSINFDQ